MGKIILALMALALQFALTITAGILIQIHGWGLTPQNWWWIIGGSMAIILFSTINMAALKILTGD